MSLTYGGVVQWHHGALDFQVNMPLPALSPCPLMHWKHSTRQTVLVYSGWSATKSWPHI